MNLKCVFSLVLLLVSNGAHAEIICPNPQLPPISEADEQFLSQIISGFPEGLNSENCQAIACKKYLSWEKSNYASYRSCSGFFVDPAGKVGALTLEIAESIAADVRKYGNHSPFMQDYAQVDKICPGYSKMNASEKVGFYSWFFENLAYKETTCSGAPKNYAADVPNGPAVGLYQLEYDPRLRSWRGPACSVSRAEILTDEGNTHCAFEIFRSQLVHHHSPFGSINARGHRTQTCYWQSANATLKHSWSAPATRRNPHPRIHEDAYHHLLRYLGKYPACGASP